MKLWLAVAALILASPAPDSGCGWTGLALAPPEVEVRGRDVGLQQPLRVVDVEKGSPADRAGMRPGMEILALDEERWDRGGFLPHLVRLQTVRPGENLEVVARQGAAERGFRLVALPCTESQARQRARMLANLGRMEEAVRGDLAGSEQFPEAREAYEHAIQEHQAALEEFESRLSDPTVRQRIEESMDAARDSLRAAREMMQSEEWHRQMDASMRQVRQAMENDETRELIEESLRQVRESEEEVRRSMHEAQRALSDEESRRLEEALQRGQAFLQDDALQAALHESLERAQGVLHDQEARKQMGQALRQLRESETANRRLLEGLERALPDDEARGQMEQALEAAAQAMQGDEWRRQLERSLRQAREALDQTAARQVETQLFQEQMRRALENAAAGREARRAALLEASAGAARIRSAGQILRGAMFQRIEPGISRHVKMDHGLLVLDLEPDSPLADAGVEPGDVLLSVEGRRVDEVHQLFELVADQVDRLGDEGGELDLEVQTATGRRTLRLPIRAAQSHVVGPL